MAIYIAFSINIVVAFDAFLEGYYNEILPGGPGDTRGVANLPFTTDTNRAADGNSLD